MRRIALTLLLLTLTAGCQTTYVRVKVWCVQPVTGSLEIEILTRKETKPCA